MKTTILVLSALLFTSLLLAQDKTEKPKPGDSIAFPDLLKKFNDKEQELKVFPEQKNRDLLTEYLRKFDTDPTLTEQYPGASRYYAKRPVFAPYGKFIIEPDTSVKYYLIIKDPLRNTITQ